MVVELVLICPRCGSGRIDYLIDSTTINARCRNCGYEWRSKLMERAVHLREGEIRWLSEEVFVTKENGVIRFYEGVTACAFCKHFKGMKGPDEIICDKGLTGKPRFVCKFFERRGV